MTLLFFLLISLVAGVRSEAHKGRYVAENGDTIQYYIENNEDFSQLLLHLITETTNEPVVNATLTKSDSDIKFHILGNDHIESTEQDFEKEAELTKELMMSGIGKELPLLSRHVFDESGITGQENSGMMLLHQLAMFSHEFHEGAHTQTRHRRNALSHVLGGNHGEKASNKVEGVFPKDIVDICNGDYLAPNGGCTVDLCVVGSSNICKKNDPYDSGPNWSVVHKFSAEEISKGCYGLCGPWCTCWKQVCGDCCWHPGCYQHDKYCDNPSSMECKLGKGVVYGTKGLHVC